MVAVKNTFVFPSTETTTGVNVLCLKLGHHLLESAVTLECWGWVTVVEAAVICADNLIIRLEHLSVDQTLDTLGKHGIVIHRLHAGLGYLEHDRPVWPGLLLSAARLATISELHCLELDVISGLVEGRVVGENGGTVEGAVRLWEIEPALVTDTLGTAATDADTNNVCAGIEELLAEADKLLVCHCLDQSIDCHCANELIVLDGCTILELNSLGIGVNR